jgi:hypothetical protein
MTTVNNVYFAFCKIMNPVEAINKANTEVSVSVVMDEDTADSWNETNPNNLYKSMKNDAFVEKYKFEAPFSNQKKQFVVTVKKMFSKDGVELPVKFRSRVFQVIDGKNVDVTFLSYVGNGSRGKLSYSTYENKYGKFAQLDAILVEDMVEYIAKDEEGSGGNGSTGSDFGDVELAVAPVGQKAVVKQSEAPPKTVVKPTKVNKAVEQDTDSPF